MVFNEKMGMAEDCFVEEPTRIMDVKEELYKSFCENNDGPHSVQARFASNGQGYMIFI